MRERVRMFGKVSILADALKPHRAGWKRFAWRVAVDPGIGRTVPSRSWEYPEGYHRRWPGLVIEPTRPEFIGLDLATAIGYGEARAMPMNIR
jgi:hypothetical protein